MSRYDLMHRYAAIKQTITKHALACKRDPQEISLVVASKMQPPAVLLQLYAQGVRHFGESRLQSALPKIEALPNDCKWHFFGSVQSNKIGNIIKNFCLVHAIDSLKLAEQISMRSQMQGIVTPILLQVKTYDEDNKHGLNCQTWQDILPLVDKLPNLEIMGLMTMAPKTNDAKIIRKCFQTLYICRENWRIYMKNPQQFHHLSMGMSQDYLIAIEEGATILRIGSAIFGM